jgi:hypothetical protein
MNLGYGKFLYHFGPKGNRKSMCLKATISNYYNLKMVKGESIFFPAIYFDLKVWNENWDNKKILKKILKYESMSLFETYEEWKNFNLEFEKGLYLMKEFTTISIIFDLIKLYYKNRDNKFLLIIDHYSSIFDKINEFENLKKYCSEEKKFDIFVIYDVNTIQDQINFLDYLPELMINSNFKQENRNLILKFTEKVPAWYYQYELSNIEEIKKYINDEYYPKKYKNYFGNNCSFLFKYFSKKNNINFEEFVKEEKYEIKNNILNYINNDYSLNLMNKYEILDNIMKNENKVIDFNFNLFKYINCSYFIFNRINIDNKIKYSYTYSFPLIKDILLEIINIYNNNYIIDIKDERFMELDGVSMGIFFDKYINNWFKTHINYGFFEFIPNDIEKVELTYLIKKNSNTFTLSKMFTKPYISKEIIMTKELNELKKKSKEIKNKKCIILFQEFNGKSTDICFLIKRDNNSNIFSINSLQIKCSDSFKINNELEINNRYEMTYLKNKFEILFDMKIKEAYVTYLSISEKPKECATKNPDKFFYYNIELETFTDDEKNILAQFPFYESCKVKFIDIEDILKFLDDYLQFIEPTLKFKFIVTAKEEVITDNIQIKNSIIIKIFNNNTKIKINFNKKNYEISRKNIPKLENNNYYFLIKLL